MEITSCPICKHALEIRELRCPACEISYRGNFSQSWLGGLDPRQLEFVKLFIIVQGNIKEMEKRLGISYPTVKNRLAEIIRLIVNESPSVEDFGDILSDLEQGFISVEEAISMIDTRRKS
ncbi:MAG: DUF2089 domain-containing protein [Candidatus Cloacimonetes bacterium]|jgi:hypothetical protein|nr:DUF2089 domain-containing protein [Candidatus Cloacimonadota bacterium]MDD3143730.1 DUF2089 domain-containing protein [Candidatus Cloacimonadota bacterium]MDY0366261.1 DUF2089 domain-containing protein [Candidatus Syntrophosphaera sp.]HOY85265.1 DUF2089 domain-containing protein [Candidatus Syntrophosphaera sp.]HPH61448.1 DUF2089 domain-containing protein [Candidatus Syntrophosphaera sp.]